MKHIWIDMDSEFLGESTYNVICPICGVHRSIYSRDNKLVKIVFEKYNKHIRTKTYECSNCSIKMRVINHRAQYRY